MNRYRRTRGGGRREGVSSGNTDAFESEIEG